MRAAVGALVAERTMSNPDYVLCFSMLASKIRYENFSIRDFRLVLKRFGHYPTGLDSVMHDNEEIKSRYAYANRVIIIYSKNLDFDTNLKFLLY